MKISVLKIETLLAEKSMTKADLANRCGISRQNVSTLIRRGTCEPRTAGKLASGLGVEVREIIEKEAKYSLQGTTQGNGLTGGVPPVRFSM